MNVLVYGSTSGQGGAIVRRLAADGHSILAFSRHSGGSLAEAHQDIETVQGDLTDPASLATAHEGVDLVILTLPLVFDLQRFRANARAAIDAAMSAGIERMIYNTSVFAGDEPLGDPLLDLIGEVAREVEVTFDAAIVRPPLLLANLQTPWTLPGIMENGELRYPIAADLPVRWISHRNLAAFVSAIINARSRGVFDVSDPDTLTGDQLAETIAQATRRLLQYRAIEAEEFAAAAAPYVGKGGARHIAELYTTLERQSPSLFARPYDEAARLLKPTLVSTKDALASDLSS